MSVVTNPTEGKCKQKPFFFLRKTNDKPKKAIIPWINTELLSSWIESDSCQMEPSCQSQEDLVFFFFNVALSIEICI